MPLSAERLRKWSIIGSYEHRTSISKEQLQERNSNDCYIISLNHDFSEKFSTSKRYIDLSVREAIGKINDNEIVYSHDELYRKDNDYYAEKQKLYSYLAYKFLETGSSEAIKFLYTSIYPANFAAINAVNLIGSTIDFTSLQNYPQESLYYLGMVFFGDISVHVVFNPNMARNCFNIIEKDIPKVESRKAYLDLIQTKCPYDDNDSVLSNTEILRKWAGEADLFSLIAKARIIQYEHFKVSPEDYSGAVIHLLNSPLKMGHPVAIKFLKDVIDETERDLYNSYDIYSFKPNLNKYAVNVNTLLDY